MGCTGIVAEYNPLHNGHVYQLQKALALCGNSSVIAVMSGNYVQRGEPALAAKFTRTEWALRAGVSMVLELPAVFSLGCAERFAKAAVGILCGTGLINSLAFGSESGDISLLKAAADTLDNEPHHISQALKSGLSSGLSYPDALCKAYGAGTAKSHVPVLSRPNDILGIEYIRALNNLKSAVQPTPVVRCGAVHDAGLPADIYASASYIRANLSGDIRSYMPDYVYEAVSGGNFPMCDAEMSVLLLYSLRRMSVEEIASLPEVSEGLEFLIFKAVREADSYADLLARLKTRRYTMARLKRICMCALLGINRLYPATSESLYIRVLGIRRDCMTLLSELTANATLPVIIKHSDTSRLSGAAECIHEIEMRSNDIYPLLNGSNRVRHEYSCPLLVI